ncbi:MAG: sigma-70 family RNA polymerase sigma factor [Actinomycetota bacterium]|nr:sigma-70 family RNA polymerase sigma factor [Actinomycetota bacterium]
MKRSGVNTDSSEAFEQIFAAHYWPVRDFVRRRASEFVVEDVVAETFLVAWRRFSEIGGDPLPWLLGVARRVLANELRGDRRRVALVDRLQGLTGTATSSWESPAEINGVLAAALGRLSEREREVLLLVAWDGLDPARAAQVLGCSPTAFRVRLHRARRRIAKELADDPGPRAVARLTEEIS